MTLPSLSLNYAHVVTTVPIVLSTVTRLILTTTVNIVPHGSNSHLETMFPSVTALDLSGWDVRAADSALCDFSRFSWQLQSFSFNRAFRQVSSMALYSLLASPICSQLKELHCADAYGPCLDDMGIQRLIDNNFNTLTMLETTAHSTPILSLVSAWCAVNSNLEILKLRIGSDVEPVDQIIEISTIALNCPLLRSVKVFSAQLTAAAFDAFMRCCPSIEHLALDLLTMKFDKHPNGRRYWEFVLLGREFEMISTILQTIDNNELCLTSAKTTGDRITAEVVDLLANKCGPTLEAFHCSLNLSQIDEPATFEHFFNSCPNLQPLTLNNCATEWL